MSQGTRKQNEKQYLVELYKLPSSLSVIELTFLHSTDQNDCL